MLASDCAARRRRAQAALRERYALLPYIYSLFRAANLEGAPIMRPLWYSFPQQSALFSEDEVYLLGDAMLVAPVLREAATSVSVPFPAGECWYDAASGAAVDTAGATDGRVDVPVTLETMPRCGPGAPAGFARLCAACICHAIPPRAIPPAAAVPPAFLALLVTFPVAGLGASAYHHTLARSACHCACHQV